MIFIARPWKLVVKHIINEISKILPALRAHGGAEKEISFWKAVFYIKGKDPKPKHPTHKRMKNLPNYLSNFIKIWKEKFLEGHLITGAHRLAKSYSILVLSIWSTVAKVNFKNALKNIYGFTFSSIILKNAQNTLKILRCEHHKVFKVFLAISLYYARKG